MGTREGNCDVVFSVIGELMHICRLSRHDNCEAKQMIVYRHPGFLKREKGFHESSSAKLLKRLRYVATCLLEDEVLC